MKNQWVTIKVREQIKNFQESNENENGTNRNLWDIEKAVQGESLYL
jgi:hypothetical protein